ncbi:MAG: dicarboxylate/amino acid:cation symporter [Propionibacteriaceae bacterium]|nr:dicarboxylate/amino acid:cation symporter [Propionibacteriaceae bacterium]
MEQYVQSFRGERRTAHLQKAGTMNILRAYRTSLILIGAIIIGGVIGIVFGERATVLQPIGQLFLNCLFMVITPLVFFCIASSVAGMTGEKSLGHIVSGVVVVYLGTSVIAGIIGLVGFKLFPPLAGADVDAVMKLMGTGDVAAQGSVGAQIVGTFTVSDFKDLFSKQFLLPLIVFATFLGFVATRLGERSAAVIRFVDTGRDIMLKMVSYIMYIAPIGIGCYFASTIGQLGSQILQGYLKGFIVYTIMGFIYFFVMYSVYAFIAGGRAGVAGFWKNIIAPAAMSLSTCSSAACIPVNLEATQRMGVSKFVSDTVTPFGANIHKEGSVFGGVFKIAFIFALFGRDLSGWTLLAALGVAVLVGTAMVAVPSGGLVAELIILNIFGFPAQALPIIAVISAIIDPQATMLNVTGNAASAMLVNRFVDRGRKVAPEPAAVAS